MFINILMFVLDVFFVWLSFSRGTKMTGMLGSGPGCQSAAWAEYFSFLLGLLIAFEGFRRLLGKPPLNIDVGRWPAWLR